MATSSSVVGPSPDPDSKFHSVTISMDRPVMEPTTTTDIGTSSQPTAPIIVDSNTRQQSLFSTKGKILILIFLWQFSYLIANTVIMINANEDAKYECGPYIYYCILCGILIHTVHIGILFVGRCLSILGFEIASCTLNVSQVLILLSSVWPVICLYGTKLSCIRQFEEKHQSLWNMLSAEAHTYLAASTIIVCVNMYNISSRYDYTYNFNRT